VDDIRRGLRLHIAGEWAAREFSDLFDAISALYEIQLILQLSAEELRQLEYLIEDSLFSRPGSWSPRYRRLLHLGYPIFPPVGIAISSLIDDPATSKARVLVQDYEELKVRRISYASPGSIDLVGIGAVMGHIKDLVFKLVDRKDTRRKRELEDETQSLENEKLRLQNAREFVALAKDCGYSELEIRQLVSRVSTVQDPIARLVSQRKLEDVSENENFG
jgi:hypothetical protein